MKEVNSNNTSTRYIFIAGSTTLEPVIENVSFELSKLKSIFKDLSVNSYLTMKAEQKVYEEHIKNKADIVVFILDGAQDDTIKELKVACQGYRKQKRPYPIFFISKESEEFQKFKDIIIANKLKKRNHLQTYESTVDLKLKAYQQVNSILHENNNDKIEFPHSKSDKIKTFLIALAALSCFLLAALIGKYLFEEKPQTERPRHTLLFTGGGSAANFLKNTYIHKAIEDIDGAYFVRMPSTLTQTLLNEEVLSPQNNSKYDMVSLSAVRASNNDFKKIVNHNSKIISVFLGTDPLVVYIDTISKHYPRFIKNHPWAKGDFITTNDLYNLILEADSTTSIFCTSVGSGTTIAYQKAFNSIGKLINLEKMMSDSTIIKYTERTFDKDPENINIVMGSENYFKDEEEIFKGFEVKKSKLDTLKVVKPIYLYFVAPLVQGVQDSLVIKKSIAHFLINDLQIKKHPKLLNVWKRLNTNSRKTEKGDYHIKFYNGPIIVEFNKERQ